MFVPRFQVKLECHKHSFIYMNIDKKRNKNGYGYHQWKTRLVAMLISIL